MIVKGIVSAIYPDTNTVAVILPEYDNAVTQPLRLYGDASVYTLNVNDFVAVICFNDDFNDGLVIGSGANISINVKGITAEVDNNTGTPVVDTHISGDADGLGINFSFKNLKGDKGNKGDKGDTGDPGVYIGTDTPPEDANVWICPDGQPSSAEMWKFKLKDGTTVVRTVWVYVDEAPEEAEEWEFVLEDGTVVVKKVVCI